MTKFEYIINGKLVNAETFKKAYLSLNTDYEFIRRRRSYKNKKRIIYILNY